MEHLIPQGVISHDVQLSSQPVTTLPTASLGVVDASASPQGICLPKSKKQASGSREEGLKLRISVPQAYSPQNKDTRRIRFGPTIWALCMRDQNGDSICLKGDSFGCGSKPMGSHFGVGEFTTHFSQFEWLDWDVHWGYDLDFDPLPFSVVQWPPFAFFLWLPH